MGSSISPPVHGMTPTRVRDNCSTWHALHEGCRKQISYYSSITAELIVLRFGMLLGTNDVRRIQ